MAREEEPLHQRPLLAREPTGVSGRAKYDAAVAPSRVSGVFWRRRKQKAEVAAERSAELDSIPSWLEATDELHLASQWPRVCKSTTTPTRLVQIRLQSKQVNITWHSPKLLLLHARVYDRLQPSFVPFLPAPSADDASPAVQSEPSGGPPSPWLGV